MCERINKKKAPPVLKTVNTFGDISVGSITVKKEYWSTLIPRVDKILRDLFHSVLEKDEWLKIFDPNYDLQVDIDVNIKNLDLSVYVHEDDFLLHKIHAFVQLIFFLFWRRCNSISRIGNVVSETS